MSHNEQGFPTPPLKTRSNTQAHSRTKPAYQQNIAPLILVLAVLWASSTLSARAGSVICLPPAYLYEPDSSGIRLLDGDGETPIPHWGVNIRLYPSEMDGFAEVLYFRLVDDDDVEVELDKAEAQ